MEKQLGFTRRLFLTWFGAGTAAVIVASCAPQQPTPAPQPAQPVTKVAAAPTTAPAREIKVQYWYTGGKIWEDFYNQKIFPEWAKRSPNIKIEVTGMGSHGDLYNKLVTSAAGGAPPELVRMKDFFTPDFAMRGTLQDLGEYINTAPHITKDKYVPKAWNNCAWTGKQVALPAHIFIHYLHMNPDLFKEAGLVNSDGTPKAPDTWEELANTARKISNPDKGIWGCQLRSYGVSEDTTNFFHVMVCQAGGRLIDEKNEKFMFNNPEGLETLKFQVQLMNEKAMLPPGISITGGVESGKVGMWWASALYWPGMLSNNPNFKWCTAINPLRKTRGAVIRGNHFVIFKGAKEKDAGWKFLSFHAEPETDYWYGQAANYVTARIENHSKPYYQGAYKNMTCVQWATEFKQLADPGNQEQPIFPGYQESSYKIAAQLSEAWLGKKSPEEALKQAEKEASDVLAMTNRFLGIRK